MWTWRFWKDAIERAIKAAAGTALSVLGVEATGQVRSVEWMGVLSAAGMGAIASLLMSVASLPAGDTGTASMVSLENLPKDNVA